MTDQKATLIIRCLRRNMLNSGIGCERLEDLDALAHAIKRWGDGAKVIITTLKETP